MTDFYAKNEKAANSFTKYVREVLNRLKQFFEKIIGTKSQSEPSKIMAKQSAEFIAELQKRYDAALLAVKEGNTARGAQKADVKVKEQKRRDMTEEEEKTGEKIADFIYSVSQMLDQSKISKRKLRVGNLSDVHKKTIENLMQTIDTSFSADGYELWIDGTGADHINIRHGENGEQDNTMASKEDRKLIPWVANSPDGAEFIRDESGELKLSNRFFNSDGSKSPQIRLYKIVDGETIYVSECVPDSKSKRIYITSAYKKGSTNQLLNIDSIESPQPTPEATFDSSTTNNSIPDFAENVNPSEEKIRNQQRIETPEASEVLRDLFETDPNFSRYTEYAADLKKYQALVQKAELYQSKIDR